jgi:L-rhamnose isomerase/sugar isomerase
LGGFHFNNRKYADDDLTVGSINPYELFLIFLELVAGENDSDPLVRNSAISCSYMFDQCPNHKPTIESIIQSAVCVQEHYAKAHLVDRVALKKARDTHDIVAAEEILKDAYNTDVRPVLVEWRKRKGLAANPLQAFRASGYTAAVTAERVARRLSSGPLPTGAFG